ncbi:MAG: DUF3592 domain-containing protein [Prosthecobacter sp.]
MLKSTRMPSRAVRPVKQMSGGCMVLFGMPFILAGLAIGWFLYLPAIHSWWSARGWEQVPCWIEKADMESSRSKNSTTYNTKARFRYVFDGRTFHSEEVSLLGGGSDNVGTFQQEAFAQIRPYQGLEKPFRCFVNPERPQQAVLFRDLRWGLLLMMSLFPMVFPLAGSLVAVLGGKQAREARHAQQLVAKHPGEPWRWRREWEGETVRASQTGVLFVLVIAGWILLVQAPLALAIIASGELAASPLAFLGLLPAALALIPLALLWRRLKMRGRLGSLSLWLKQTPVSPGRALEGELRFDRMLSPLTTVNVRVLCQRQITRRSGDSTTTSKETLWEHSEGFSAAEARRDIGGMALPLRIDIPPGLPCSMVEDAAFILGDDEQHVWSMEVSTETGGRAVILPLPVFIRQGDVVPAQPDTTCQVEAIAPNTAQLQERLKARGLNVEFDTNGLPTLLDCPPGRFKGMSWFLLFFGSVWSIAFVAMLFGGAPFIFLLVWGTTSPLILGLGVWTLLHCRRVDISPGEMRVTDTVGPLYSKRQTFELRHFVGFSHDSNMQSGNQFYYRVRGETIFGKKLTLVDGITESVTAQTLANKLENWRKKGTGEDADFGRRHGWFIEKDGVKIGELDYVRWDESSQFWHDYRVRWYRPEDAVEGPDAWVEQKLVLRNRRHTDVVAESFLTGGQRDDIIPVRGALVPTNTPL